MRLQWNKKIRGVRKPPRMLSHYQYSKPRELVKNLLFTSLKIKKKLKIVNSMKIAKLKIKNCNK